jgi:hypothetical protein
VVHSTNLAAIAALALACERESAPLLQNASAPHGSFPAHPLATHGQTPDPRRHPTFALTLGGLISCRLGSCGRLTLRPPLPITPAPLAGFLPTWPWARLWQRHRGRRTELPWPAETIGLPRQLERV